MRRYHEDTPKRSVEHHRPRRKETRMLTAHRPVVRTTLGALILLFALGATASAQSERLAFTFTGTLSGNQFATPVETDGTGTVVAVLTGNQLVVTGTFQNLTREVTRANLRHAPRGEDGPAMHLTAEQVVVGNDRSAVLDVTGERNGTFSGVFTLTDEQLAELADGLLYVQIDTGTPSGEVRGQLRPNPLYIKYRAYLTELEEPGVVRDATAQDLVGIWRRSDGGGVQVYEDGTWHEWETFSEIGRPASRLDTWTFEDGLFNLSWIGGSQIELPLLYQDGRLRYLVIEGQGRYHEPSYRYPEPDGMWRELVRIDEEGNPVR